MIGPIKTLKVRRTGWCLQNHGITIPSTAKNSRSEVIADFLQHDCGDATNLRRWREVRDAGAFKVVPIYEEATLTKGE